MTAYLKPYLDLTEAERDAVHAWLDEHGIDHRDVPVKGTFTQAASGEWLIERFLRDDTGSFYPDAGREIASEIVHITPSRPLPWPRTDEKTEPTP